MANFDADATRRIARTVRTIELDPGSGHAPRPDAPRGTGPPRWFWTTSTISAAVEAGTTVSTATLLNGTGTARRCVRDPATGKKKPDTTTGAVDVTIENPVQATIPTGRFVRCSVVGGKLEIDMSSRCT